jgi:hypothetical protein
VIFYLKNTSKFSSKNIVKKSRQGTPDPRLKTSFSLAEQRSDVSEFIICLVLIKNFFEKF